MRFHTVSEFGITIYIAISDQTEIVGLLIGGWRVKDIGSDHFETADEARIHLRVDVTVIGTAQSSVNEV